MSDRPQIDITFGHALMMCVRNLQTLNPQELEDLINSDTALLCDNDNADYTIVKG